MTQKVPTPTEPKQTANLHKQGSHTEGACTNKGPDTEGVYRERAQAQKELAQARPRTQGVQAERPRD